MDVPKLITGAIHKDLRGSLSYNNDFDLQSIRRMYLISNANTSLKRGWQGHLVESRWFQPVLGAFKIDVVLLTSDQSVARHEKFEIHAKKCEVLHVPPGYATCITSLTDENSLMVYSDYQLGAVEDDHRFDIGHFNILDLEND